MVEKKLPHTKTIFTARFKSGIFKTDTKMMCRKSTSGLPQQTKCQRTDRQRAGRVQTAGWHTHKHFHKKKRFSKLAL